MKLSGAILVMAAAGSIVAAAPPTISNAKMTTHAVSGSLKAEVQKLIAGSSAPMWVGYSVPIAGEHHNCCWQSDGDITIRGCNLEDGKMQLPSPTATAPVQLEAPKEAVILFRAEGNAVQKIRTFTSDCLLDAGGLDVAWLDNVKPSDSVAYLAEFVGNAGKTREDDRMARSALGAIALHSDPAAQTVLESHLAPTESESIRRHVVHSMAWRGDAGFQVLERLQKDPDERIREAVAHAFAATNRPQAAQILSSMAAADQSGRVRGSALIALATLRAPNAAQTIQHAVETDTDRHVQHSGIAALQMLPPEQGVPMLIALVRSSKSDDIRRSAMQQLGHSRDPRAKQFIDEVLSK